MNNRRYLRWGYAVVITTLILSGCGPGQIFGPTITPTPTRTPIPPTSTPTLAPPTFTLTPTLSFTDTSIPTVENSVVDGKLVCTYQVSAYDNSTAKEYLETGIDLVQDEKLIIAASGWACFDGPNMDNCNDPNGHPDFDDTDLVGKIGNGEMFHVGTSFQKTISSEIGRLYLGFYDSDYENNSGYFDVTVVVENALSGKCNP
jgi:hypothetical protein